MNQRSSSSDPTVPSSPTPSAAYQDPDEINLLEYAYVIVKNKWWIIGATILGIAIGMVAAYVKGPRYVAEAVIAPKESESSKAPNLSALGAFGGLAAAQLGLGGNASLDKIDQLITSREFNASFIEKHSLLPMIYRNAWPKVYGKNWDSARNDWKADFVKPKRLDMGAFIKGMYIKTVTKNNVMTLTVSTTDSTFSDSLLTWYLEYLNGYVKTQVQTDANDNVSYLNKQLETVADPLMREKFQSLIANEVEKAMMVSKEAFRVVDPVYRQQQFKEKKLYPMVSGAGLFFVVVMLIVLGHALVTGEKTEEDRKLIENIKKAVTRV